MKNTSQIMPSSQIAPTSPIPIIYNVFELAICIERPRKNIDFSFLKFEDKLVIESYDPADHHTITHLDISNDELVALVALFTQRCLILHNPHVCYIDNAFESTICIKSPGKHVDFSYLKLEDRFIIESYNPIDYATITHLDISSEEREKLATLFRLVTPPQVLNLVA